MGAHYCRQQLFSSPSCQCALGCFQNPLGSMELSPLPPLHCLGTASVELGASSHGLSSNPVPSSPGEQLADSSPIKEVTGPPPATLHPLHWLMGWTLNHSDAECWAGQAPCVLKLTWPIKALLCRSALAGVWTCRAGSREVGLVCQCCLCGDSAAVSGCAQAPWHHLLSHGAAWGRAQFSPHCWSKGPHLALTFTVQ